MDIASLLSFVAGIVNVAGFLSVQRLTTNVTGHFAYFVDEVFKLDPLKGLIYFLYIFFFFFGSFVSSFMVELISKRADRYVYVIPTIFESTILFSVAFSGNQLIAKYPDILAFCLLFAMGLQNSLVTKISNARVRTTHLTGLFTDLGIELAQLFFYKQRKQAGKLWSSIKLRLTIIGFFFLGGIAGGILYSMIGIYVLSIAGAILLLGIIADEIKLSRFLKRETTD
ncbi:MAG: hypothetical protein K0S09_569 [Sphingobacteriaceae bacterium]|jgi:uncharacterized membrane protein YoaK (UPF0700 family)|nr:hypothetical protein [Sphingobacteriaceae bacterium]